VKTQKIISILLIVLLLFSGQPFQISFAEPNINPSTKHLGKLFSEGQMCYEKIFFKRSSQEMSIYISKETLDSFLSFLKNLPDKEKISYSKTDFVECKKNNCSNITDPLSCYEIKKEYIKYYEKFQSLRPKEISVVGDEYKKIIKENKIIEDCGTTVTNDIIDLSQLETCKGADNPDFKKIVLKMAEQKFLELINDYHFNVPANIYLGDIQVSRIQDDETSYNKALLYYINATEGLIGQPNDNMGKDYNEKNKLISFYDNLIASVKTIDTLSYRIITDSSIKELKNKGKIRKGVLTVLEQIPQNKKFFIIKIGNTGNMTDYLSEKLTELEKNKPIKLTDNEKNIIYEQYPPILLYENGNDCVKKLLKRLDTNEIREKIKKFQQEQCPPCALINLDGTATLSDGNIILQKDFRTLSDESINIIDGSWKGKNIQLCFPPAKPCAVIHSDGTAILSNNKKLSETEFIKLDDNTIKLNNGEILKLCLVLDKCILLTNPDGSLILSDNTIIPEDQFAKLKDGSIQINNKTVVRPCKISDKCILIEYNGVLSFRDGEKILTDNVERLASDFIKVDDQIYKICLPLYNRNMLLTYSFVFPGSGRLLHFQDTKNEKDKWIGLTLMSASAACGMWLLFGTANQPFDSNNAIWPAVGLFSLNCLSILDSIWFMGDEGLPVKGENKNQ